MTCHTPQVRVQFMQESLAVVLESVYYKVWIPLCHILSNYRACGVHKSTLTIYLSGQWNGELMETELHSTWSRIWHRGLCTILI